MRTSRLAMLKGFTVGFCGSCTTFATWQIVVGTKAINGRWLDACLQSLFTFCTSYQAYVWGRHCHGLLKAVLSLLPSGEGEREKKRQENGREEKEMNGGVECIEMSPRHTPPLPRHARLLAPPKYK